jgi:tetratricopeptide (TPR) repeat protein
MFESVKTNDPAKLEAIQLFNEAYAAQMAGNFDAAIKLYKESIAVLPTAEAFTFLGWVYSFQARYGEAIAECLAAISIDAGFGNPYNDIGSYLIAKGDNYGCVRWFKLAMQATRYEARGYPHFNLATVLEKRGKFLEAAKHYGLALKMQPDYKNAYNALRKMQMRLN